MSLNKIDLGLINFFKKAFVPTARFGFFVVFFWFGFLKVIGLSPASGVVQRLFENTIPFMEFSTFLVLFGLFECLIGILFLIKGAERIVMPLLLIHMITTFGPLVYLPEEAWQKFLVPTLEGQYIIKNIVFVAAAMGVSAQLHPIKK